jgi:hypothetical protein
MQQHPNGERRFGPLSRLVRLTRYLWPGGRVNPYATSTVVRAAAHVLLPDLMRVWVLCERDEILIFVQVSAPGCNLAGSYSA